jgi:SagB-type dehydrogenase family enzyme
VGDGPAEEVRVSAGHGDAEVVDELLAVHARAALTAAEIVAVPDARTAGDVSPARPAGEGADDDPPQVGARASGVDHVLPEPSDGMDSLTLVEALASRRTSRQPAPGPLAVRQLGALLHHAARATPDGRRPHPSAGATYPLSVDVVALRCEGLPAGVHRYDPVAHGLVTRSVRSRTAEVVTAVGRSWVGDARALLVIVADLDVAARMHGPRGYRYALLEAGHLAQSLLLLCADDDVPACPVGGFADAALAASLGLPDAEVALTAVVL